jgi:hypothetical protein
VFSDLVGERPAHEMGARRSGSRPLCGRHQLRVPTLAEADRFLEDFRERLGRFGLELRPDKTRLPPRKPLPRPRVGGKDAIPHFSAGGEAVDGDCVIALAGFQPDSWEIGMIR